MDVLLYYYDTASHTTSWIITSWMFQQQFGNASVPSIGGQNERSVSIVAFSIHTGSSFNKLEVLQLPYIEPL